MAPAAAAGVRSVDVDGGAASDYFHHSRPEVRALIPVRARRVLDVGCGAGALGRALKDERDVEVCGLELFEASAAIAREHLDEVIVADLDALDALPHPAGTFDAIVFADVLEHLHDPARLLTTLRPYLAPGGVIVCSIPNVKHWTVLYPLLVADRWEYTDAGLLDRTHVHFFTLEEIGRMMDACAFDVASVTGVMQPLPAELKALVDVAVLFGADAGETEGRLGVYQYLVVATPR